MQEKHHKKAESHGVLPREISVADKAGGPLNEILGSSVTTLLLDIKTDTK